MESIDVQLVKLAKSYIGRNFNTSESELTQIFYDSNMTFDDLVSELVYYAYSRINEYDASKATLATYAYMLFRTKVLNIIRYNKKRYFNTNSLNDNISDDTTLLDLLEDNTNINDEINKKEIYNYLQNRKNSDILNMWLEGTTQTQIAKKYNVSQSNISRIIKLEIKKIKSELISRGLM